jgi:hypothetical protein
MKKISPIRSIRIFLALFFTISAVNGIMSDYENDVPTEETIGGVIFVLILNYFLLRPSKKKDVEVDESKNFEKDEVEKDDTFDEVQTDILEKNHDQKLFKDRNPVNDKQSLLSRIFQGKTDRY